MDQFKLLYQKIDWFYSNIAAGLPTLILCVTCKLDTLFYIKNIAWIPPCVGQAITRDSGEPSPLRGREFKFPIMSNLKKNTKL